MKQTGSLDKIQLQWDRSRTYPIFPNGIPARLLVREW